MIYLTDDLNVFLGKVNGLPLLQPYSADLPQIERLLQMNEWQSCISRKFAAKMLIKILGRDIPVGKKDTIKVKKGDIVIDFHIDLWFRDDEVLSKEEIQQLFFKFSAMKIADVVNVKGNRVNYFH